MKYNDSFFYSSKINSIELLRSLSINGSDAFNMRILDQSSLLEEANIRLGFLIKDNVLTNDEIIERVLSFFLDKISLSNISFQDIKHFINTTNQIRHYILSNDELETLKALYNKHQDNISLKLLIDYFENYLSSLDKDIDPIIFIHKIIEVVKEKPFSKIYYFKEDYLSPLELNLISSLANEIEEVNVIDLFIKKEKSKIKSISPRYGIRNEVAHVIKDILTNQYPLGECEIVLINNPSYTHELFKFKSNMNLNMTFGCGLPINLTDGYKLYHSLLKLGDKYFYDVNGYLNLFSSESLDLEKLGVSKKIQVAQILGRMKVCFDKKINDEYLSKYENLKNNYQEDFDLFLEKIDRSIIYNKDEVLNQVEHVIKEFSKGIDYIIENYTKNNIDDFKLHEAGVRFIVDTLRYASSNVPDSIKESYLSIIETKMINKESFKDDSIHVVSIDKCLSVIRKHIYIIGMNSAYYPGSLAQDFLFSDDLYEELSGVSKLTETTLNNKNEYLRSVINTYLSLGVDLSLSYNAQEIKEVRELNPCSVLLDFVEEYYSNEKLNEAKEKCSYYDDELSPLFDITKVAIDNNSIVHKEIEVIQKTNTDDLLSKSYSPSTLPAFMMCPLKFYLTSVCKADNVITYDPLRPMSGNRFGDLLHYVMEMFLKNKPNASLKEILTDAERIYDLYVSLDRSCSDDYLEKKPFLSSVENAYLYLINTFDLAESHTELDIGKKEEKAKAKIGNIFFAGNIDLIIKDKNGNYVVLDYKTGSKIEHVNDDPITCIQGLIYSQLFEKIYGITISKLVFYYTRFDKAITFNHPCSDTAKKLLLEQVDKFESSLKDLSFNVANEEDKEKACKYCKFMNICSKVKKPAEIKEVEEEEE